MVAKYQSFQEAIDAGDCDFLDFGVSQGRSFLQVQSQLGYGRGIGLDVDARKVTRARSRGIEAYVQDVITLGEMHPCCELVMISHLLDHLPSFELVKECVRKAARSARAFVVVRQPYFDSNAYLFKQGLKLRSANWTDKANMLTSFDIWASCQPMLDAGSHALSLYGKSPIADSSHNSIVPLSVPADRAGTFPASSNGEIVVFDQPVFEEIIAVLYDKTYAGKVPLTRLIRNLKPGRKIAAFGEAENRPASIAETSAKADARSISKKSENADAGEQGRPDALPNVQQSDRHFLFLCGIPRGGTTALVKLFNTSQRISIGIERYRNLLNSRPKEFNRNLFDFDRFFEFRPSDTTVIMEAGYRRLRAKFQTSLIVGDKVPHLYKRCPVVFQRIPEAKVLFITRDVVEVGMSWQKRADDPKDNWPLRNGFQAAVTAWNEANRIALALSSERPRQFGLLFYDELYSSGIQQVLNATFDWLCEDGLWSQARSALEAIETSGFEGGRLKAEVPKEYRDYAEAHADWETYLQLRARSIFGSSAASGTTHINAS